MNLEKCLRCNLKKLLTHSTEHFSLSGYCVCDVTRGFENTGSKPLQPRMEPLCEHLTQNRTKECVSSHYNSFNSISSVVNLLPVTQIFHFLKVSPTLKSVPSCYYPKNRYIFYKFNNYLNRITQIIQVPVFL